MFVFYNFSKLPLNRIKTILELLKQSEYLGQSELIDIAKGKYELTTTIKAKINQKKRLKAWQ